MASFVNLVWMNEDDLYSWTKYALAHSFRLHIRAKTDTVFFPISEVSKSTVSLYTFILIKVSWKQLREGFQKKSIQKWTGGGFYKLPRPPLFEKWTAGNFLHDFVLFFSFWQTVQGYYSEPNSIRHGSQKHHFCVVLALQPFKLGGQV